MKPLNELSPLARRMYISFGMLTIWTVAGPTLAFVSVKRGFSDEWPPENLLEWVGFWLAVGGFSVLMFCTFWYALRQPRRAKYVPGQKKSGQING
ncbi:MAG: hypothetical protein ACKO85_16290 [Isosphaeraceae bacterium]